MEMKKTVLVEVSARHVHLSDEHLNILFGEGYQLTKKKDLSQPGQFACEERVDIVGPRSEIKNVGILGPTRKETQVEVTLSEARSLGVQALVRESGDLHGTVGCTLVGPAGEVVLEKGLIAAKRHLHLNENEAGFFNLKDKEIIGLRIKSSDRSLIFGDLVVRVNPMYLEAVHIDTDEANAAGISGGYGEIVAIEQERVFKMPNTQINLKRDSVCAGDDVEDHNQTIDIATPLDMTDTIMHIGKEYLPHVEGNSHTWDCILNGTKVAVINSNCTSITKITEASFISEENSLYFKYNGVSLDTKTD